MSDYDFIKMQKKLAKYLDENRYEHTLGVMFTCASLAMVHGYDLKNAQVAGLLHDSAKCIPNKKKLRYVQNTIFRSVILKKNTRFFFMLNWGHILQRQNIMSQIRRFFLQSHIIQQVNRI